MVFALAGNQNCGKTTLFNQLTGSNQHVGNFPGVTVDKKEGVIRGHNTCEHRHGPRSWGHPKTPAPAVCEMATVVDLPGIYSLSPYTSEEIVTRDFLIKEKPDGIINIVDATNIERNLYLSMQLIELNLPMVIALNMMDEMRANGNTVDVNKLEEELGVAMPDEVLKDVQTVRARCTAASIRWRTSWRTTPRPQACPCALPPQNWWRATSP